MSRQKRSTRKFGLAGQIMGTRRSKHNKGVKPEYKDHRKGIGAEGLPADLEWNAFTQYVSTHFPDGPKCPDCGSKDHYTIRSRKKFKCADCLKQYAPTHGTPFHAHKISYTKINEIEAMKPCGATELATRLGLSYKGAWILKSRLAERSTSWATIVYEAKVEQLAYPYIKRRSSETDLIMEVNRLVPQSLGYDRGDICQEILLAILEGKATLEELRANRSNIRAYIRLCNKANKEMAGHAFSIYDEEWGSNEVHSALAARDWHSNERGLIASAVGNFQHYQKPTQIEDAYQSEIGRLTEHLHESGIFWSPSDVSDYFAEMGD